MSNVEKIDRTYIYNTIQRILNKVHTNRQKLKINDRQSDRLRFACPICGDSARNMSEKRGHLYFKNLYYVCYNEGCRATFTNLCKKFDIELDIEVQEKIRNYVSLQLELYNKQNNEWFMSNFDKLIPKETFFDWMNNNLKSPFKSLQPVSFGSEVYTYLLKRGFTENQAKEYFYEAIKVMPWGKEESYLVSLNIKDDKIVGMQERNLKPGAFRRFKIWTFKDLYDNIYETDLDLVESIGYNKLSYLFNIFNVNFGNTVTIFEGYIDSLFYPNSIGSVGVNTDFNLFIQNDIEIQFFLDNDDVGKKKSYEYLKQGYKVFIWERLIKDLASKEVDPYNWTKIFNRHIKDINDLMLNTDLKWYDIQKYFSNDPIDILNINFKIETYKEKKEKEKKKKNIHNYEWNLTNKIYK